MLVVVLAIIIIPDVYSFEPDMQDSSGTTKNGFYTKYSYSDIFIDYNNEELWTADGNGGSYAYLNSKSAAFDKIKSMFPNGPSSDEVAKRQAYDQRPGSPSNVVYIHKFYVHNYGTDDMYIQDRASKTYNTVDFIIRLK